MFKISVWNPKGGVGKTTLSLNLAAAIMEGGRSVILADLDPQASALMVARDGNLPFPVVDKIPKGGADVLLMDHPPGYTILPPEAKAVIMPMRAARLDMQAGLKAVTALKETKMKIIVAINFFKKQHKTEYQTFNRAIKMNLFSEVKTIKSRTVYKKALDEGRTVFDNAIKKAHACQEARREILGLLKK